MMTEPTKGPYKAGGRDNQEVVVVSNPSVRVAWCGEMGVYGEDSYSINKKEAKANARFLASSWDMYEALKDITAFVAWHCFGECRAVNGSKGRILPAHEAYEKAVAALKQAAPDD